MARAVGVLEMEVEVVVAEVGAQGAAKLVMKPSSW